MYSEQKEKLITHCYTESKQMCTHSSGKQNTGVKAQEEFLWNSCEPLKKHNSYSQFRMFQASHGIKPQNSP